VTTYTISIQSRARWTILRDRLGLFLPEPGTLDVLA